MNDKSIESAIKYYEEMKELASLILEDVTDSNSPSEAWSKIEKFYKDIESMRSKTIETSSSKTFENAKEGHAKYLQGLDVPIMVNSISKTENGSRPSKVCEMHNGHSFNPTLEELLDSPKLKDPNLFILRHLENEGGSLDALCQYRQMSNALCNCLKRCGYKDLREIAAQTKKRVLRHYGMGVVRFKELEEIMRKFNLRFADENK